MINTQLQHDYKKTRCNRHEILSTIRQNTARKTNTTTSLGKKTKNKTSSGLSGGRLLCSLLGVSSTGSRREVDDEESKAGNSVPGAFGTGGTAGNTPVGLQKSIYKQKKRLTPNVHALTSITKITTG